MPYPTQRLMERARAIAQRDHLQPIAATRQDTGEPVWFLQSRSDPTRYYVLTKVNGAIRCGCLQYQHQEVCAHLAAVQMLHQAAQGSTSTPPEIAPTSSQQTSPPRTPVQHRQAREQQYRQEARRREVALLWTDDKPFSIWKS